MSYFIIFYKTERKTHPSFLRGWGVSDHSQNEWKYLQKNVAVMRKKCIFVKK